MTTCSRTLLLSFVPACVALALAGEPVKDSAVRSPVKPGALAGYYHHTGPGAGTLKSDAPLPVYDSAPRHLWNRVFSAFYIRPRRFAATRRRPALVRYEGGDVIEFLAWGQTRYWSSAEVAGKVTRLLDEFLRTRGEKLLRAPLKRAIFQHDLWAVYDHLIDQNIKRSGDLKTRRRRDVLCRKLATCIRRLALSPMEIKQLPDTYARAVKSGRFTRKHDFNPAANYLPSGLMTNPDEWVEIDFYHPKMHEDIMDRFISLHARSLQGRSYYRIFYRFPKGRKQVVSYLKMLEKRGVDWKRAAQFGFIPPPKNVPQIPVGTEVALVQFMVTLDDQLRPVPTPIVESIQMRIFRNVDGTAQPETNTGVGMNVLDYRLKRHLLFSGRESSGLHREREEEPQYRVAIDGLKSTAPDWGFAGKKVLFQQCADCHMSRKLERLGVAGIPSITHSGGFDAGAQMGISRPLDAKLGNVRGKRVARYKSRQESYRRLLEHLGL